MTGGTTAPAGHGDVDGGGEHDEKHGEAYGELIARVRELHLLESSADLLRWDQETMLPPGGVAHRARQLALLARLAHERAVDPAIGELLSECERRADPDATRQTNVRELRRRFDRAVRLPAALCGEIAETESLAQHEWALARRDSDFARFRPWLEKLLRLVQQKADCLAAGTAAGTAAGRWDALADEFEPGVSARDLEATFAALRIRLTGLLDELRGRGRTPAAAGRIELPLRRQEALVRMVVARIGFDFDRGRLDRSMHPFCSGSHPGDVRITTRFRDDGVLDALGSAMHEAGHGLYEQGLPAAHSGTPFGQAVSLGVHESQSRLWENHVGRSLAFWQFLAPELQRHEALGGALGGVGPDQLFAAVNLVRPSLIRVEADEATYDLHVMVRFELEQALLCGDLAAADLPGAWRELYRDFLGIEVPDDRRGSLQDVHWSCGLYGYFPTYTLGNLYAAQFFAAARRALADLDAQIVAGHFGGLKTFLNERIHAHGMRYRAAELCRAVTGEPLSAEPFLRHLEDKLRPLYGV